MLKNKEVQVLWPAGEKTSKGLEWRVMALGLMFSVGSMMAVITTWSVFGAFKSPIHAAATIGVLCGVIYDLLTPRHKLAWLSFVIPWPLLLAYTGLSSWIIGLQAWLNQIITGVNEVHSGKINVFSVNATEADAHAFVLILALFVGQQTWSIVKHNKIMSSVVGCILWLVLMTASGSFSPAAATLLICAFYGLFLASRSIKLMHRNMVWVTIIGVALILLGASNGKVKAALYIHDALIEGVHDVRYGKTTLPMGDLSKADELWTDNGDMLTVTTQQVKSLYLKGYTGSDYVDGQWKDLPYTAYIGENAGMYKWLEGNGFDPMTQTASYYMLCDDKDTPEENTVSIDVSGACRWYGYIPSSLEQLQEGSFKENDDRGFESKGLIGEKNYTYTEISGTKPSELTVAEDWVSDPSTPEEKKYCESEAVYRKYVYSNYTQTDKEYASLMSSLFWSDYSMKNDSAYNAIEHVRKVLRNNNQYNANADSSYADGTDPLYDFLQNKSEGNSVYFASAGVMALRAHGIPARYAEGYYVSSAALQAAQSSKYTVGSRNAHAWVEVYFDGIGWLPVDVTPGYYMSASDMQQMFTAPENVQKTAAFDDSLSQSNQNGGDSGSGDEKSADEESSALNIAVIVLGIAAIVIMILAALIVITETARVFILWYDRRRIERSPQDVRVKKFADKMYRLLKIYGIDAGLSWNTKETDRALSERFGYINPGEYTNACKIIEQQVYGGMTLAIYQERTLNAFIMKLFEAGKKQNLAIRIKLHYFV
ncbi:transglutaminase-like domain-containing protein [Agathobacter sp.]